MSDRDAVAICGPMGVSVHIKCPRCNVGPVAP